MTLSSQGPQSRVDSVTEGAGKRISRRAVRVLIRAYQLTLSSLIGRQCRHMPSCSTYADEAIERHGLWPGGWMAMARLCRCHPWGTSGFDPVPDHLDVTARWYLPWRYGRWTTTAPKSAHER